MAARAAFALGAAVAFPDAKQAGAAGEVPEIGIWIDHEGKGAIEIKPCGAALCGNIVWVKNPVNDQGQPLFDRRNPDETKRNRPICGLPVIGNLRRMTDGWDEGWIYSPEEGSQYDVALKAASKDKLVVTGYKGVKLFSKTFTWTRAPADFQRCGTTESKAKPAAAPAAKVAIPKPPQPQDPSAAKPVVKPATASAATSVTAVKPPAAKPAVVKATAPAGQPAAKTATQPAASAVATTPAKKAVAKDAAAKAPATVQPAKKAAALPVAKPGEKQPAGALPSGQKKPAQAAKAAPPETKKAAPEAKKTAATSPAASPAKDGIVAPKPTAAKKPAAAAATSTQPATEKKAVPKKQTAEETEASSAE